VEYDGDMRMYNRENSPSVTEVADGAPPLRNKMKMNNKNKSRCHDQDIANSYRTE
jgi:hypothetical protein